MSFKPTLAYTVKDMSKLQYPLLASPKLDGIRCVIKDGAARSRTLKKIPNNFIQAKLKGYPAFDGELVIGDPTDPTAFNRSTSGIMSHGGEPDFTYWVFDHTENPEDTFVKRLNVALTAIEREAHKWPRVRIVPHTVVGNEAELMAFEAGAVSQGFEGVMVRSPKGHYKFGRSTENQGLLGKVKRFEDTEGTIVGFEELMHNDNPEVFNEALGVNERSTSIENLTPGGTLGSLVVSHNDYLETFGVGTGFTAEDRCTLWQNRDNLLGEMVRFKHQPAGALDRPRFPVYLGIRKD